ncbi:MAG: hypothetical protein RLO80_08610 [Hyphomonas sp.]
MTLRVARSRRPRVLEAPEVLRILSRGGILFESGGVWSVYRTHDARGLRVGIVPAQMAEWLEAEGHARHLAGLRGGAPRLAEARR